MDKKPEQDDDRNEQMARQMRYGLTYILVGLVVLWLFQQFVVMPLTMQAVEIPYSEFRAKLAAGEIVRVEIGPTAILGDMKTTDTSAANGGGSTTGSADASAAPATQRFDTFFQPENDPDLVQDLQAAGVQYQFARPASPVGAFLLSWILLCCCWPASGTFCSEPAHRPAVGLAVAAWAASSVSARARLKRSSRRTWA